MLNIQFLPARQGDAIWIRWGTGGSVHQMLVDLGTSATGEAFRRRIESLPSDQRFFDLLVVTHIDSDHIGGALTVLTAQPIEGFDVGEVWFNGYQHLDPQSQASLPILESLGPAQGERLARWLMNRLWNHAFQGGSVCNVPGAAPPAIFLPEGLKLTVLGPTPERLAGLRTTWTAEVHDAFARRAEPIQAPGDLEAYGSTVPLLRNAADLDALAAKGVLNDTSRANGSSIILLVEFEGISLLLTGDAFSGDIVQGVRSLGREGPLRADLVKLPHHGSKQNVHQSLVESVDCDRWLISTDGTKFRHPDVEAVARVIRFARRRPATICFNTCSPCNSFWDNADWQKRYAYSTQYGSDADGIAFAFP